jgi:hypothetical protein
MPVWQSKCTKVRFLHFTRPLLPSFPYGPSKQKFFVRCCNERDHNRRQKYSSQPTKSVNWHPSLRKGLLPYPPTWCMYHRPAGRRVFGCLFNWLIDCVSLSVVVMISNCYSNHYWFCSSSSSSSKGYLLHCHDFKFQLTKSTSEDDLISKFLILERKEKECVDLSIVSATVMDEWR